MQVYEPTDVEEEETECPLCGKLFILKAPFAETILAVHYGDIICPECMME